MLESQVKDGEERHTLVSVKGLFKLIEKDQVSYTVLVGVNSKEEALQRLGSLIQAGVVWIK